ncbi:hypothetical protein [Chitinophaga pinensis]|uniref:Uncharacterized protein n=1 Tax=Chitinophaga pinensis (strain ATCC 43595 / DSM 2588 / LMG 13176 / NBRC 15968 / NCIMB 11800 / UQM 2034) TaxID=485918 RepID=A0A979FZ45_CHIPD|nr:hypothetical protein [Chitinophaga pinensis]ACU57789.1 hypothetical protein Cpin_0290 [Chitinophaga pinensis DSM 2588]
MSRQQAQLIEALRSLGMEKATIIPAQVEKSDKAKGTIDVITFDDLKIPNVRLRSVIEEDGKGLLTFPAEKTSVLIARINKSDNYVVVSIQEPEMIKCKVGEKYLELDKDGLEVSAGDDTLKKCLDDLLDEIITIYAPMNKAAFTAIKDRLAKLLK